MDFSFDPAQEAFLAEVRRFATDVVAPRAAAIDATGEFPKDLVAAAAAIGLTGVTLPTAVGGGARPYVTYATALESVSAASATLAVILSVTNSLVAEPVSEFGTAEQKELWLGRLASGRSLGSFALSEAQAGSDAGNQQTTARLDDRGYVLSGRKTWVANAEVADVAIVFAATQPGVAAASARSLCPSTLRASRANHRPIRWVCVVSAAWIWCSRTCVSAPTRSSVKPARASGLRCVRLKVAV